MLLLLVLLLGARVLPAGGLPRPPSPPRLPQLPVEDGCMVASPEVELFRVEGEAVVLSFPFLHSILRDRRISLSAATVLISKTNLSDINNSSQPPILKAEGRVLQRGAQLWLLPAQESDSGQYTCTYRTQELCVRGGLTLHVHSSRSMDWDRLSYRVTVTEGEHLSFKCPSLSVFNGTETKVHWNKVSGPVDSFGSGGGRLLIPSVRWGHRGRYRCEAKVNLNQRGFTVSRVVLITVQENPLVLPHDPWVTSDPKLTPAQTDFKAAPPVILSPLNGSVFQNSHGSGLELICTVLLPDCARAEAARVTWHVDGQSVETSYLEGRALQGDRRVLLVPDGCSVEVRLMILEMRERDTGADLKCVAENQHGRREASVRLQLEDSTHVWLVVSSVAFLCLLSVVLVFLWVLVRPRPSRTKVDYTLARQSSTYLSEG